LIHLWGFDKGVQVFPELTSIGKIINVDDRICRCDGFEMRGVSHVNGNRTREESMKYLFSDAIGTCRVFSGIEEHLIANTTTHYLFYSISTPLYLPLIFITLSSLFFYSFPTLPYYTPQIFPTRTVLLIAVLVSRSRSINIKA
jgi:hypothetical protein